MNIPIPIELAASLQKVKQVDYFNNLYTFDSRLMNCVFFIYKKFDRNDYKHFSDEDIAMILEIQAGLTQEQFDAKHCICKN